MTRAPASADLGMQASIRLREMIAGRALLPGQKLRQVELSQQLGYSRSPIREALRSLEAEGLITHEPKRGYAVARPTADELQQVYRMQELLEDELLRSLHAATDAEIASLRATNEAIGDALDAASVEQVVSLNRQFHFQIFAMSPHDLIRREIDRLWNRAGPYQGIYVWMPSTRDAMCEAHDQMIDAVASNDLERLVALSRDHREQARVGVLSLISPGAG